MTEIADVLSADGFPVFLPHRDGMEFRCVHQVLVERGWQAAPAAHHLHAAIFALDVFQLASECGGMVWNLNGRTPDEGAVSEAAIAWTLGKPLVAFSDDARSLIAGQINPLLAGLVNFETVRAIDEIPAALQTAFESQPLSSPPAESLAPNLQRAVDEGRRLWAAMTAEETTGCDEAIADVVVRLFIPEQERPALI